MRNLILELIMRGPLAASDRLEAEIMRNLEELGYEL